MANIITEEEVFKEEEVPLIFENENPEDHLSVFSLEDLIREYNYKIQKDPPFMCTYKRPLSLTPIITGDKLTIRAMTQQEIDAIERMKRAEWHRMMFNDVLRDQITPQGILTHVPDIAGAVTLRELVSEIGLMGKVIWKKTGGKIYVILKGRPGIRHIMRGTRYLNTLQKLCGLA